jgi:serine/threonine-protein kinase RsbW
MTIDPLILDTITGPNTLDQIQHTLDLLWQQYPEASATARIHIDLAACEIGANICKHAAGGQPVRMRLQAEVCGPNVRVSFTDDGHPTPIDLSAVGMPVEMAEQGRGLALAVAVLDELSFQRDSTMNRWTLVRRLRD